ncbi:MAG TPA: hypothetical protein VHQ86_02765 [Candidatus Saccharimonadia bacterium]|nr:hypothetical protein [Candidatus Saccharimonadia bacterium]
MLTGGDVPSGVTINFTITATAANSIDPPASWQVNATDDPGGGAPVTCNGSTYVRIDNPPPPQLQVSNVRVSNVGTDRVTVLWDSNLASTSEVDYGLDSSYGQSTPTDSNLVTSHSVLISGLTASMAYHYVVTSTTPSDGNSASSSDNTFITADKAAISDGGGVPGASVVPTIIIPGGLPIQATPTESTPPTVALTTQISGVYQAAPKITGIASDNVGVARVDYSTDGGKNWSSVRQITPTTVGKGKNAHASNTLVTFDFTPVLNNDGNYSIMARATDTSANQSQTAPVTLVIDRLPPKFGPSVVAIGPQAINPAADGTLVVPAGVDFKLTVSMVGGPVTATVGAQASGTAPQSFSLTQSPEPGLWVGILSFAKAGKYALTGQAVDGAGNTGSRLLAVVTVVPPVTVAGDAGALKHAVGQLYVYNEEDKSWALWEAGAYGEANPQALGGDHSLNWLVPAGTYYLKVAVPGRMDILTRTFTVDQPTPLSGRLKLENAHLSLGPVSIPLPWTALALPPLVTVKAGTPVVAGTRLPLVNLPTTAGGTATPVDWYGRPTAVITLATWAPASAEELDAISQLAANTDINVVPVAVQEQSETLAAYLKIAGSSITGVADPDGLFSSTLTVPGVPTIYLIDRHGIIKKVMVGSHTADQILTGLSHL